MKCAHTFHCFADIILIYWTLLVITNIQKIKNLSYALIDYVTSERKGDVDECDSLLT